MQVKMRDFTLSYASQGQGRPLLLVHGFPLNKRLWQPQLSGLSDAAQVLAPDLRGFGQSQATPGVYTMDLLAADLDEFLDALDIRQPVVICGLSMGGYIALAFWRQYAARLAGLILAATRASPDSPEGRASREATARQVRTEGVQAITSGMLPKLLSPYTYQENTEIVAFTRQMMNENSVEGLAGASLGMKERPDAHPGLKEITAPTLILYGADDQIIPRSEVEAMQADIPYSRLEVLPQAGHLLNLEQPEKFNQSVRQFLSELSVT